MGAQETFGRDIDDREVILREVLKLTAKVARRMRVAGVAGRTVSITVRFADFTTITRSRTMPEATDVTQEIYRTAVRALRRPRAAAGPAAAGRGPGRGAGAADHRAPPAGARRARARLVRRRPGRGPGDPAVRRRAAVRPASLLVPLTSARDRSV